MFSTFKENYFCVDENEQRYLYYNEWGRRGDRIIICVHGLTRNCRDFDVIANELVKIGYYVICPDVAGRGKSTRFNKPENYNYHQYTKDLIKLIDHLNIKYIDWLGSSLGGIIAMFVSSIRPTLINKLIFNDIGSYVPIDPMKKIAKYLGLDPEFDDISSVKLHMKKMLSQFGIRSEENWEYITENSCYKTLDQKYKLSFDPKIAVEFCKMVENNPNGNDFNHIWDKTCFSDLLILHGLESQILLKETVDQMIGSKNNIHYYPLKGVGHTPSLMETPQIDPIINFLK